MLGPGSLYVDVQSKGIGNDASPTSITQGDLGCYIYGFANHFKCLFFFVCVFFWGVGGRGNLAF